MKIKYVCILLVILYLSPIVLVSNDQSNEQDKKLKKGIKTQFDPGYNVRCDVGKIGVLLHYGINIGDGSYNEPSFEYPKNSNNNYLYRGLFWLRYKDVISDDWEYYNIYRFPNGSLEYIAQSAGVPGIKKSSSHLENSPDWAVSDLDTRSDWFDKYDPGLNPEGTNIWGTFITHAWSDSLIDDFIVWDITLTNKDSVPKYGLYIGLKMDCDISTAGGGSGATGYWRDDLTSYYDGTNDNFPEDNNTVFISYMYDSDSPVIPGDDIGGTQTPKESPGYVGTITLSSPKPDDPLLSANKPSTHTWWDWDDPSSNQETYDYLAWGANNPDYPYRPTPPSPHDYLYLSGWGPYDLDPGESVRLVFASGIGDWFDGMYTNLSNAKLLYLNDYNIGDFLYPPTGLKVKTWTETSVTLSWGVGLNAKNYNVYFGKLLTTGYLKDKIKANSEPVSDKEFLISGLECETLYHFAVTSIDEDGRETGLSEIISFNTGLPSKPSGLKCTPGKSKVFLSWSNNPESNILGYNVYRRSEQETDYSKINSTPVLFINFIDTDLENYVTYYYRITALSNNGLESSYSDEVEVIPAFTPTGRILFLDDQTMDINGNIFDELEENKRDWFYENYVLRGSNYDQWDVKLKNAYPDANVLDQYSTVILIGGNNGNSMGEKTGYKYEYYLTRYFQDPMTISDPEVINDLKEMRPLWSDCSIADSTSGL